MGSAPLVHCHGYDQCNTHQGGGQTGCNHEQGRKQAGQLLPAFHFDQHEFTQGRRHEGNAHDAAGKSDDETFPSKSFCLRLGAACSALSVGVKEMHEALLCENMAACDIPEAWVTNHYRWIIWKFASLERAFPSTFGGKLLNADKVFEQLKMRCMWEFSMAKRSFIKKLIEKDELSTRHIVLCVSKIRPSEDETLSTTDENAGVLIELTD